MARFRTTGIDELIDRMKELGELTGEIADEMLLAGAEEVKLSWKEAINLHGLKLTGQLIDSIGFPRKPASINGIRQIDIYPQGYSTFTESPDGKRINRKKRVRNAAIAFINHYGTSKIKPTHFVDTADSLSEKRVYDRMSKIWAEALKEKGLT